MADVLERLVLIAYEAGDYLRMHAFGNTFDYLHPDKGVIAVRDHVFEKTLGHVTFRSE